MKQWLAGLAAIALAGCVSPYEPVSLDPEPAAGGRTFRIDSSVLDPAAVREAAKGVNDFVGRPVLTERADGFPVTNTPLDGLSGQWRHTNLPVDETECARAGAGYTHEYLTVTLMHEFGHSLGMGHVQLSDSIMSPNINHGSHWTDFDRTECERVGLCLSPDAGP